MSLSISLQNALSALKYAQSAIQVTSNNVANANTDGYSRKLVSPISQAIGGKGAGVLISAVSREIDENLTRDLRTQTSQLGSLQIRNDFFQLMQDMFGSLAGDGSLTAGVSDLATKMEALAAFPEDAATRLGVINAATALARQFNDMSDRIQTMRADADNKISTALTTINGELKNIETLNEQIARNKALGESTAELEDQRDTSIAKVAEYLDITTFTRSTGETVVMTKSGRVLVDGTAVSLTHTPVAGIDASVTYPGGIDGIKVGGVDITTEIGGGRLAGLIEMRDKTLVDLQSEIEALAIQLRDQINAIHNDGVGFPAANTLTGTRTVAGTDAFVGTGTVRIAVVDANGAAVAAPLDLDLTTVSTVTDVVNAINAALTGSATASIVSGKLVISANNASNGIAINERTSSVGGRGFSHYFGLNDFFVGDATVSFARNIAVRSDIVANPSLLSRGELSEGVLAVGATAITSGGNSVIQRLADVFRQDISFSAAGGLAATTTTLGDYASLILSRNASTAAQTEDDLAFRKTVLDDLTFRAQSISGVNVDEEMANLVVLQNSFAAASRVISVTSDLMDQLLRIL